METRRRERNLMGGDDTGRRGLRLETQLTNIAKMIYASMTRKFIPVEEAFAEWRKDPAYMTAYDALEEEFALANALVQARARADLTQEQVAKAMGTTQAAIARLESGRSMPSTRTLARFAKATGTRLRFSFEPIKQSASKQSRTGAAHRRARRQTAR